MAVARLKVLYDISRLRHPTLFAIRAADAQHGHRRSTPHFTQRREMVGIGVDVAELDIEAERSTRAKGTVLVVGSLSPMGPCGEPNCALPNVMSPGT